MNVAKRVCKDCMNEHVRIYSGRKGKNLFYRDEHGLLWNGRTCGGCNRVRVRGAVNKHRQKKLAQNGPDGTN